MIFYYYSLISGFFIGFVKWIIDGYLASSQYINNENDIAIIIIALLCALLDFPAILYLKQNGKIYRYHIYNAIQVGAGVISNFLLVLYHQNLIKRLFDIPENDNEAIDLLSQYYVVFFYFIVTIIVMKIIFFTTIYIMKLKNNNK